MQHKMLTLYIKDNKWCNIIVGYWNRD
jgi:hypothetical protein